MGAQTSARPSERERHAVFGPGEALRRERAAGHDSTLSFTIAAAAKTAVFIIVTASGSHTEAELRQSCALRGCLPRKLVLELAADRSNRSEPPSGLLHDTPRPRTPALNRQRARDAAL